MHVKHYHPEHAVIHSPTVTDLAFIRTHKEEAPGTATDIESPFYWILNVYIYRSPRH